MEGATQRTWDFELDPLLIAAGGIAAARNCRKLLASIATYGCADPRRIVLGADDEWILAPSLEELAASVGVSRVTVYRWVRTARENGCPGLSITTATGGDAELGRYNLLVRWDAVRACSRQNEAPSLPKMKRLRSAFISENEAPSKALRSAFNSAESAPPSPLLKDLRLTTTSSNHVWGEVEEELIQTGMGRPAEAIASARANGVSPDQARELIAHWRSRPHAWSHGALYRRLANPAAAKMPTEQGWPRPNDDEAKVRRDADRAAAEQRATAESTAIRERREADRRKREAIEAECGAAVDRLSLDEQAALLGPGPLARLLRQHGPHAEIVRPTLLAAYARRVNCSGGEDPSRYESVAGRTDEAGNRGG